LWMLTSTVAVWMLERAKPGYINLRISV
jgi:hypothetical protein